MAEQHRQEQDSILQRQLEAEIAALANHGAQAARLGQLTGQNYGVTIALVSETSSPITGYPQMPLER